MARTDLVSAPRVNSVGFTVDGDTFSLTGFTLVEFDHVLAKWAAQRGNGGLTPAQLKALLARAKTTADRAEAAATALESLDAQTP